MKKWIAALCIALLAWNVFLTARLYNGQPVPSGGESGVVDTKVTNYTTELTETVSAWRSSVVTVSFGSSYVSGVIFAAEENNVYIFTASEPANSESGAAVIFDSGARLSADVVGSDYETGLTLLRVPVGFEVTPFTSGDSSLLKQGEYVVILGGRRPSTGTGTVSFGVVSEPGQRKVSLQSSWNANVIETDATVTADAYGGPLMNMGGELAGMLIPRPVGGQERMGYAVSVNEMKLVYGELTENGSVTRGSIGIVGRSIRDLRNYEKNSMGIPLDTVSGVLVTSVSGEENSVLSAGDVLTAIGQEKISDTDDLRRILYDHAPEDQVDITFIHEGQEMTESVTLQ